MSGGDYILNISNRDRKIRKDDSFEQLISLSLYTNAQQIPQLISGSADQKWSTQITAGSPTTLRKTKLYHIATGRGRMTGISRRRSRTARAGRRYRHRFRSRRLASSASWTSPTRPCERPGLQRASKRSLSPTSPRTSSSSASSGTPPCPTPMVSPMLRLFP